MVILRLFALVFIVVALMLLGADVVATLEKGGEITLCSLGSALGLVHGDPTAWIEMTFPASVAGVFTAVLGFPGWAVTGVLGILCALISFRSE